MELPSTYELHSLSEKHDSFECPISDKELKWQYIRLVITEMQEATSNGKYSIAYWFPKDLLPNKKVLKSVANFFRDQKYDVDHDIKDHNGGECMHISWYNEFYRYNE